MKKKLSKELRERLLSQRGSILKQHLNNRAIMPVPGELATGDAADAASNNDVKEMALNLKESEKKALEVVEEALAKMDAGTYGFCEECQNLIPEKRLLALPYAKFCVACQEKMETEKP